MSFKELIDIPGVKPVMFTLLMTAFGFGVILPILPFYATSLGATPFELGMLTSVFAFMSLLFGPIAGKMADKYGRKKVLLAGTASFFIGYLIFAFTHSLQAAFLARAMEGVAAAAIFPACISLLSDFTTEQQRGKAMGLVAMSFSLGFIIGPAFGGLAAAISVQTAFLLSALFAALNFASVLLQVREPVEKAESKDLAQKEVSLLEHISSPVLFLFLSSAITTFMIGGLDAVLALSTSERLGFTSAEVGILFTYIGVLILTMQFVASHAINRFGEKRLIPVGLALSGLGFFLLEFAGGWPMLMLALGVFVAGNAAVFPSVTSLITKKVTGKRGAVLGLNSSFQSAGQLLGPLYGGFLYGINHQYAFPGLAIAIWIYALFFYFKASKKL